MKKSVEALLRGGQFKQFTEQELTDLRKTYNLKRIDLEVIYFLSICGEEDTVAGIHEYLSANRGHISQSVFRLCECGYVTSQQDKHDRRYTHYILTAQGRAIADKMNMVWDKIRREMYAGISDEEIEVFKRVSLKISQNIKNCLH